MKTVGIIAEYNPFHNGHKYHIDKAKELSDADTCMIVMSGDFTQRGEPAIIDKWTRAEIAVKNGADLVVELPFIFACNRASYFARGGVDILAAAGVDSISFGCECNDAEMLENVAEVMLSEKASIEELRSIHMKKGVSYAKANEMAIGEILGETAADLIKHPNNILAIEYLMRIYQHRSVGKIIKPVPVRRYGSGYKEINTRDCFAGASAIRSMDIKDVKKYVPEESWNVIKDEKPLYIREDAMLNILKGIIIREDAKRIGEIYAIGEGFENKIKKEIASAENMQSFIKELVSARYTAAAVRRMLTSILVNVYGTDADAIIHDDNSAASYLRILAVNKQGREYLKTIKKQESSALQVTNINKILGNMDGVKKLLIDYDIKAADMYNLISGNDLIKKSDHIIKPYISY